MARPEKVARVEAVVKSVENVRSVVLADFSGLDVTKISELRALCRENNVEFKVVKNTLAKLGVKGTEVEGLSDYFEGPTAIAISHEAENTPAKVLKDFAAEHEAPKFKAGYVDGNVIDATGVLALANMPAKDEMYAMILRGITAPANGLLACIQGPARNLVGVLNQIIEKSE